MQVKTLSSDVLTHMLLTPSIIQKGPVGLFKRHLSDKSTSQVEYGQRGGSALSQPGASRRPDLHPHSGVSFQGYCVRPNLAQQGAPPRPSQALEPSQLGWQAARQEGESEGDEGGGDADGCGQSRP